MLAFHIHSTQIIFLLWVHDRAFHLEKVVATMGVGVGVEQVEHLADLEEWVLEQGNRSIMIRIIVSLISFLVLCMLFS